MKLTGLPTVVTLSVHRDEQMFDGVSVFEACRRLEAAGADVVGLNCQRGPATLLPVIRRVRERSEEHTSELQSLMRISYAVFCLKKKNNQIQNNQTHTRSLITQKDRTR